MSDSHEVLWSQYNARGVSPELVAKTFVAPKQFGEVALPRNTVVLGPRGSGKTTLLRMLDPRALLAWDRKGATRYRKSITYVGAFVPIDAPYILSLRQPYTDVTGVADDALAVVVYSLALGRAVVEQMVWRLKDPSSGKIGVRLSGAEERELVSHIAELWLPGMQSRSLAELRLQLTQRIAITPRSWLSGGDETRSHLAATYANPLELAIATCEVFNHYAGEPDRVWALLCDELEIAPPGIQRMLFSALRAPSSRLLLKLAFSPALRSPLALGIDPPAATHDYDVVSLSHPTRQEGPAKVAREEFCRALWNNLLEEKGLDPANPANSAYKVFQNARASQTPLSRTAAREGFVELSRIDPSFAHYLKDKRVRLDGFEENPIELFNSVIRKVRPIVEARLQYLRAGEDGIRRASKVTHTLYTGAERIFAMSEGHPRWFKATLGAMLASRSSKDGRVSLAAQTREIELSIARLESRIKAFPVERNASMSTYAFICRVGGYFEDQILGDDFHADPYLSFLVDNEVPDDVLGCIEKSLYLGVVIPMQNESGTIFFDGIRGHRFRISNWLAPKFRLPLITGRPVHLSRILATNAPAGRADPGRRAQLDLGLDDGE